MLIKNHYDKNGSNAFSKIGKASYKKSICNIPTIAFLDKENLK
jgi:hypothetical protein